MKHRRARLQDPPYVMTLEAQFRELDSVGGNDLPTHEQRIATGCLHWVIKSDEQASGLAILRGFTSINHSLELKRIVIAEPGHGFGRRVVDSIVQEVFEHNAGRPPWIDACIAPPRNAQYRCFRNLP